MSNKHSFTVYFSNIKPLVWQDIYEEYTIKIFPRYSADSSSCLFYPNSLLSASPAEIPPVNVRKHIIEFHSYICCSYINIHLKNHSVFSKRSTRPKCFLVVLINHVYMPPSPLMKITFITYVGFVYDCRNSLKGLKICHKLRIY